MKTVTAAQANREFSRLLRDVQEGETVTITSHGRPVARLVAAEDASAKKEALKQRLRELERRPSRSQPERVTESFSRDWAYDE